MKRDTLRNEDGSMEWKWKQKDRLAVFVFGFLLFLLVVVLFVIHSLQFNGVGRDNFEIGPTLRTRNDFAFLDFFFVNVEIALALRTENHDAFSSLDTLLIFTSLGAEVKRPPLVFRKERNDTFPACSAGPPMAALRPPVARAHLHFSRRLGECSREASTGCPNCRSHSTSFRSAHPGQYR